MSVAELVTYVQNTYPPAGRLPRNGQPRPITRRPPPSWLDPEVAQKLSRGADVYVLDHSTNDSSADDAAHYLPFHFYPSWGIYLRASGVATLAARIASAAGYDGRTASRIARDVLVERGRFRFLAEIACSRAEIARSKRVYAKYFNDPVAASHEDALADAATLRRTLRCESSRVAAAVDAWLRTKSDAHERWLDDEAFHAGRRTLANHMLGRTTFTEAVPAEFVFASPGRGAPPMLLMPDVDVHLFRPLPSFGGVRLYVDLCNHAHPHVHVQMPPGSDLSRLEWPSLRPLDGEPYLFRDERAALAAYLERYGARIESRIESVYGSLAA